MQLWSRRRRRWRGTLRVTLLLAVLASIGCTGPDEEQEVATAEEALPSDLGSKPELVAVLPDDRGDPPTDLQEEDLVDGEGEIAESGDRLTVHFVGASWGSGQEFDATWDRGQPFTFSLGQGEVIEGWEEGLVGMREGGRRALVIPPELAYGDRGAAAGVEPGETIVFIVDLLEVAEGPGVDPAG